MQHRVKHSVSPFDFVTGKAFHFLNQLVAITFTPWKAGTKSMVRSKRATSSFVKHADILHCVAMYVNMENEKKFLESEISLANR